VKIFQESFAECGVDTNQIHFRGDSSYIKLFEEYLSIDIALDPFPFSGAATSFDALWMGVPVVTLAGHRPSGRQTLSFLKVIGLEELVAGSVDEYVEIAVKLASDKSKLSTLRAELRTRLAESPLCDGKRFTSELERLYRQVWSEWCRTADNNMNYNC
jgi:predicted O-linked N-acetylglucosamine transferase (SPINDLY family)